MVICAYSPTFSLTRDHANSNCFVLTNDLKHRQQCVPLQGVWIELVPADVEF